MRRIYKFFVTLIEKLIITLIKIYKRYISPMLPHACRYTPTCSEYMLQAVQIYGVWKGGYLGLKRLFRCHPFGKSGYDPVPLPKSGNKDTD